jgi:hypothetical protein
MLGHEAVWWRLYYINSSGDLFQMLNMYLVSRCFIKL